jgi:hypothetical protein
MKMNSIYAYVMDLRKYGYAVSTEMLQMEASKQHEYSIFL